MKLYEAMLDVARFLTTVVTSTATSGGSGYLEDGSLVYPTGFFERSPLWILSGANIGTVCNVVNHVGSKLIVQESVSFTGGVSYAVAHPKFTANEYKEAVNFVLVNLPVVDWNISLTVDTDVEEYTLPDGVTEDIRRVEIATNSTEPYMFVPIHRWRIINGKLEITDDIYADDDGLKIRLTYVRKHGSLSFTTDDIDSTVLPDYLRHAGALYLMRRIIQKTQLDDPKATELFNEAKMLESEWKSKQYSKIPRRDTRYSML